MVKKVGTFALVLVVCLTMSAFSLQHEAHAADHAYYTNSFPGGYSLGAYSWFNYVDVRCGANSYIDYSGNSSKPIDSISIDYDAYNVSGVIQFSDYEQRPNTGGFLLETPVGVLEKSTSIFDFKNNGYEWKPTQRIYNCAFGSASVSQMPQKYKNIADKNSLGKVKSIIENDYANDIKSFTVNNRPLNIDDFKLDKTIKKQGFDFEDGTMKYHNTIKTNYSFVSISTSESVKRDGKLYNIKAYILVIDTKNHNDEVNTSLYIEPVKK